jgi:diadenosine tetraphosphate (Ap4A) HIT family hydrolase
LGHSNNSVSPISAWLSETRQRGHFSSETSFSSRLAAAPQWEQNLAPMNIMPKQAGHAMVASRAPQCSHFEDSVEADAPHIGQFNVMAAML